jgi:hypothetical protein
MNRLWKWLTATPPLLDGRDALARVGGRFLWVTGPYFVLSAIT